MRGNMVGLITALLTALVVLWQGYDGYQQAHPAPVTHVVQKPVLPAEEATPIYWHDGHSWYCQVGDKQYVWVNNQNQKKEERLAWNQPLIRQ